MFLSRAGRSSKAKAIITRLSPKMIKVYDITPCPAPRQTRKDKFDPSPAVRKYHAFRDEVGYKIKSLPEEFFHVVFMMPIPKSWTKKRKKQMHGTPHKSTPDKDNMEKALIDAVYRNIDDSHVWNTASTKIWANDGAIIISDEFIPLSVFKNIKEGLYKKVKAGLLPDDGN